MYRIIGIDNKEYGPVSIEVLKQWIKEGRVNQKTLVKPEGEQHWRQLSTYPELVALFHPQQFPSSAPPPLSVQFPSTDASDDTNGMAVASLIFGIISLIFCFCCCWGFPFNILAIIFGILALTQSKNRPDSSSTRSMAITGIVLGVLSILFAAIVTMFFIFSGEYEKFMREFKGFRI
jgi:hypothetical protein